jgi:hypothetical protein
MFAAKIDISPDYAVNGSDNKEPRIYPGGSCKAVRGEDHDPSLWTRPPVIRGQAFAYRDKLESLLSFYMREAIKSDRTTVFNALNDAGHPELAELIRRL